ncbi:MAG: glycosyl transferase [Solidesulfovibrio magneticus str. Maddingley MBC34]|uniref:Glycosyl transferase n=1 Tax=Solidesulfovibrio magneticus str. Maddingley MBC34 TaxID=1206767 RepID=K6GAS0_9BACT|nr:MAG: glycosyl transferase [Solidesulfovibrio magneticus str. Maddingley MBC34]
MDNINIAVVIPCYKVRGKILEVVGSIESYVSRIYVVDDSCPEGTGQYVSKECSDSRVVVITNAVNKGVGGAVIEGYRAAASGGADIIVKIDGDGQMDAKLIPSLVGPIVEGRADYTKGNRFYDIETLHGMPKIRLFGNAILSFVSKFSSGYWQIFDPTNGFTAIHCGVLMLLPFSKISNRYFFESDMLFRLNTVRAVVVDVPMSAKYGDEVSGLCVRKILLEFIAKHCSNFVKRIFYNYYLRDMSVASFELPLGVLLCVWGFIFGVGEWISSVELNIFASAGTVMLAALPLIFGVQFLLAFINYDINAVPTQVLHKIIDLRH